MKPWGQAISDLVPAPADRNNVTTTHHSHNSPSSDATNSAALLELPFTELLARARQVRDDTYGTRVTYSPKVFIPLTMLCQDKCGYCTFAQPPARLESPFLSPREVLKIARQGAKVGTHEALFTLGERPELRYPIAQEWLRDNGYETTVDYTAAPRQRWRPVRRRTRSVARGLAEPRHDDRVAEPEPQSPPWRP